MITEDWPEGVAHIYKKDEFFSLAAQVNKDANK